MTSRSSASSHRKLLSRCGPPSIPRRTSSLKRADPENATAGINKQSQAVKDVIRRGYREGWTVSEIRNEVEKICYQAIPENSIREAMHWHEKTSNESHRGILKNKAYASSNKSWEDTSSTASGSRSSSNVAKSVRFEPEAVPDPGFAHHIICRGVYQGATIDDIFNALTEMDFIEFDRADIESYIASQFSSHLDENLSRAGPYSNYADAVMQTSSTSLVSLAGVRDLDEQAVDFIRRAYSNDVVPGDISNFLIAMGYLECTEADVRAVIGLYWLDKWWSKEFPGKLSRRALTEGMQV